ncbi:hypothetical protein OIDMADRAFT_54116 [Oidiodendron maius Zn]|uniref:SprT-like domain-containing protein n=1 Tax=Oidiodendron maius (strain Zn) TaxID=913774 RepID=A0A0C3GY05_OIDMZ|nr:hypothetical protein OIDMADRAFT_54116 [Oidiodendron maius Zn]
MDGHELETNEPRIDNATEKESKASDREMRRKRLEALSASVKKTKRVLQPRSDNPLLRPLGRTGDAPIDLLEIIPKSRSQRDIKGVEERNLVNFSDTDEEERVSYDESDGISDFIVDDDDSLREEDSEIEEMPPRQRSARRLVRGRKQVQEEEEEPEDLETKMERLDISDGDIMSNLEDSSSEEDMSSKESDCRVSQPEEAYKESTKPTRDTEEVENTASKANSNTEELFTKEPAVYSNGYQKEGEDACFTTPPPSPRIKPRSLTSPKKIQHIPMTPHRPSMDDFWSQEAVNDWNDEHSPRKAPISQPKKLRSEDLSNARSDQAQLDRATKKAFNAVKDKVAREFLLELDEKMTGGQVSKMAKESGGVEIVWSKTLNSTAGQALWKGVRLEDNTHLPGSKRSPAYVHHATIELAEKVVTNEDRLLNVMAHEFCHLCAIMIDEDRSNAHGTVFKRWAAKCDRHFNHRGVKITTKHNYDIDYKFVWECTNCGIEYERHSKSIDPTRVGCGICLSKLVQTKPKPNPAIARKPNSYQVYVKENMKRIKDENPGSPQKEIMSLVAQEYQKAKALSIRGGRIGEETDLEAVMDVEVGYSQEGTPEAEDDFLDGALGVGITNVVKKLNFVNPFNPLG